MSTITSFQGFHQERIANYSRRGWLKLVKVDPTLRPSVFKLAYEICEYANAETGEFFPAAKTLAEGGDVSDGIAMSEATVIEDLKKLEAAGYLTCIKRGRRGRGHSSRFRIVLKPQPAEISGMSQRARDRAVKTSVSCPENLRMASVKPQPADMNLREPGEPKSAPPARRSEFVTPSGVSQPRASLLGTSSCGTLVESAPVGASAKNKQGITLNSTDPFAALNAKLGVDEIPW